MERPEEENLNLAQPLSDDRRPGGGKTLIFAANREEAQVIIEKKVNGVVEYNDGEFAEVQTFGIEGFEKNLLLAKMQLHRESINDSPQEFQHRFPLDARLEIATTIKVRRAEARKRDFGHGPLDAAGTGMTLPLTFLKTTEKLDSSSVQSVADVVRQLQESSPGWLYDPSAENGWDATAILLFSAAVLGTTDPWTLARFTGYGVGFVCAVAWNMRNNRLWTATRYLPKRWSLEGGIDDRSPFWEEVSVGCGSQWEPGAESEESVLADMMDIHQ